MTVFTFPSIDCIDSFGEYSLGLPLKDVLTRVPCCGSLPTVLDEQLTLAVIAQLDNPCFLRILMVQQSLNVRSYII